MIKTLRLKRAMRTPEKFFWSLKPDKFANFYLFKKILTMNKAELIAKISEDTDVTRTQANAVLDSFVNTVTQALKEGGKVTLVGFGTFSVSKRIERNGRNPQTGEMIKIKAKKVAKFKAGKELSARI